MTASTEDQSKKPLPWKKIAIGALVIGAIIAAYSLLPLNEWISSFQNWVKGYGALGWIIFIIVYAIATFALVPGALLTIAAGVIWGLWGFPIVVAGAVVGSAISFLVARYALFERVQKMLETRPKLRAVNDAISDEGWKVVFLLRLSPALPFSLQNWFLGITSVGFWSSQIATLVGILPGTLLYVWIGSLGGQAGDDMSTVKYIVFGVGLLATLAVTILVTRKAQEKLKQYTDT